MNSGAFVNPELSWLELNRRLLEEAQDPSLPLLERVKCLADFSSKLDEFFMRDVAGLQSRIRADDQSAGPDGLSPAKTRAAVTSRVHELAAEQHRCFLNEIRPRLASEGIFLLRPDEASEEQQRFIGKYFRDSLLPVLTPLAIDSGQPFPYLGNRSLCLVASIRPWAPSLFPHTTQSVIHIPGQVLPRFIRLPGPVDTHVFMLLEDVVRLHLPTIYAGYDIVSSHLIRVTRDAGVPSRGSEDPDARFEESPRDRRRGPAVRLQCDSDLPPEIRSRLLAELALSPADLFEGFAAFSDLAQLYAAVDLPQLKTKSMALLPARPSTPPTQHLKPLGQHLILDLFNCDAKLIGSLQDVKTSMLEAASRARATVVQLVFHEFSPFGVSGVVVIAESHLAIHTWPEYRYAAVDIFTCGEVLEPKVAAEYLAQLLGATQVSVVQLERGHRRPDDARNDPLFTTSGRPSLPLQGPTPLQVLPPAPPGQPPAGLPAENSPKRKSAQGF